MKPIPGYEGIYSATKKGDVFSHRSKRKLSRINHSLGYDRVRLVNRCGDHEMKYLHVLIALTYLGEKPEGMEVNHKDLDKKNNNVKNLEYVTHQRNVYHAARAHIAMGRSWGYHKVVQ